MADVEELCASRKVPENVRMLQRVMVKLKADIRDPIGLLGSHLEKAARYTGLQTKVLEDLKNSDVYKIEFKEIDRSLIYNALASLYLEKCKLPSTQQLFETLHSQIPPYVDIRSFRKLLVKMGFMWKRCSWSNLCYVMERPTVIFERYEYLKNIIQYRSEGRTIYFIDENALKSTGEYLTQKESKLCSKHHPDIFQQKVIYAVSKTGIHSAKFIDSFDEDTFMEWLESDLLPNVETDSVIVLDNSKHHREQLIQPPNEESLKIELCQWLEYHKVPFNEEMSKYELLNLTENFTDVSVNMYKIDRRIQQRGVNVLRLPDCIKKLTPASLVFNLINENKEIFFSASDISEAAFVEALESIPPKEHLVRFDGYTADQEKKIYNIDLAIDSMSDNLLNKLRHLRMSNDDVDTDIPSCSDSE